MARGKNNTTPVGNGSVGVTNTGTGVDKLVGKAVSEQNLKYQLGKNSALKGVFNATLQMVSRWLPGDKIRIIQEYGNYAKLPKNPTEDQINKVLAETLVANMSTDELKRIIGDEEVKQNKIAKDVRAINGRNLVNSKKYFSPEFMKQAYNAYGMNATNGNKLIKNIKKDFDIKLSRRMRKSLSLLRRELKEALKYYNNMELGQICIKLEIEMPERDSMGSAKNKIINLVEMYASMLLDEKVKGVYPSEFSEESVKTIEGLLVQCPSYGYLVKDGMSDAELEQKRKLAKSRKREIQLRESRLKSTAYMTGTKKFGDNKGKELSRFAKQNINKTYTNNRRKYAAVDEQLKNMEWSALKLLAEHNGMPGATLLPENEPVNKSTGKVIPTLRNNIVKYLIAVIAKTNRSEEKRAGKELRMSKNLFRTSNSRKEHADTAKSIKNGLTGKSTNPLFKEFNEVQLGKGSQDFSDKVPIVKLGDEGKLISTEITSAVPVVLVGITKAGQIQKVADADAKKKAQAEAYKTRTLGKSKFGTAVSGTPTDSSDASSVKESAKESAESSDSAKSAGSLETIRVERKVRDAVKHTNAVKDTFTEKGALSVLKTAPPNVISTMANLAISDQLKEILDYQDKLDIYQSQILSVLSTDLPTLFAGLQEVGTSVNAASAGAGVAKALAIADDLSSINAVGGRSKAKSNVSTIITGDAPKWKNPNSNNTEAVSVDWESRKIDVKPIPKMATGGSASKVADSGSNVTRMSKLSLADQNSPLSVGITSNLIKYSKTLSDVTDDGSQTAVKVYSVNTGINEKIKVGDIEMSLFDAVYGMYASVSAISTEITTSNSLLQTIATNTMNTNNNIKQMISTSNSGGAYEFPSNLDSILSGD